MHAETTKMGRSMSLDPDLEENECDKAMHRVYNLIQHIHDGLSCIPFGSQAKADCAGYHTACWAFNSDDEAGSGISLKRPSGLLDEF